MLLTFSTQLHVAYFNGVWLKILCDVPAFPFLLTFGEGFVRRLFKFCVTCALVESCFIDTARESSFFTDKEEMKEIYGEGEIL